MTSKTSKKERSKAKWLVRVILVNGGEYTFSLGTKEIREFIVKTGHSAEQSSKSAGIINKYIFPYVFDRFKDQPFKAIKVRGNYV